MNNAEVSYTPPDSSSGEGVQYIGTIATYICSSGYQLVGGTSVRACGADGEWNGTVPSCGKCTTIVDTEILQYVVFLCMHAQVYAPIIVIHAPVFIVLYQLYIYIAIDGYSALLYHTLTISPLNFALFAIGFVGSSTLCPNYTLLHAMLLNAANCDRDLKLLCSSALYTNIIN